MHQTLKIVKNELEMRKLWPLKVKGSRTQKEKKTPTIKDYKGQFPNIQKNFFCMLLCCY